MSQNIFNLNNLQRKMHQFGIDFLNQFSINKNKINDEGKIYFMLDVQIDPKTGSKKISISNNVYFYNNLDIDIEIGILFNYSLQVHIFKFKN